MQTMEDLSKHNMQPYKACWITWEGYKICKLTLWKDFANDEDGYVFTPNYEEWEKAGKPDLDGINLDLGLENYVRIGILPAFCYKRFIPIERTDWDYYRDWWGMPFELGRDPWELMMYSGGLIMEDNFRVERCEVDS